MTPKVVPIREYNSSLIFCCVVYCWCWMKLIPVEMKEGQISIPTAVKEEVTRKNDSVKAELESCDWIHVEPITDSTSKSIGKGDKQCHHWI